MTTLEITLIAILWIIIGLWISWKMDCYSFSDGSYIGLTIFLNIVFMPIAILITFVNQFIKREWKN